MLCFSNELWWCGIELNFQGFTFSTQANKWDCKKYPVRDVQGGRIGGKQTFYNDPIHSQYEWSVKAKLSSSLTWDVGNENE